MRRLGSTVNAPVTCAPGGGDRVIEADTLSAEKRAQILQGATVVFGQDGYEGASMSRIAREASVSKGTLYNHFESKAELFRSHVEQACTRYLGDLFATLDHGAELEDALRRIGRRMVDMLLTPERRSIYRMVISEAEHFPELARAFYEAGPMTAVAAMSAWIDTQVHAGKLKPEDSNFAAEQFFALCQTRLWMRYRLHLQVVPSEAEISQVVDGAVLTFLARYGMPP